MIYQIEAKGAFNSQAVLSLQSLNSFLLDQYIIKYIFQHVVNDIN